MENLNLNRVYKVQTEMKQPKRLVVNHENGEEVSLISTQDNVIHVVRGDSIITESFDCGGNIINFEHLIHENSICIATEDGCVFLQHLDGAKQQEEAAFCSDGIEAMKFSLDQEMVAFVTKTQNMVLMNCTLDVVAEQSLLSEDFGDRQFMQVGWGKTETQFRGSAKKPVDSREVPTILARNSCITWREDAEYFAILFTSQQRQFKVFSRDGTLTFTSESGNGLGCCLAWRPSGNWIAVPEVKQHCTFVTLFEKNGLRHRELTLPFQASNETVQDISWSNDSEVLMVQTKSETDYWHLYLFTMANYHWYLKQTLDFTEAIISVDWNRQGVDRKVLHVLLGSGCRIVYSWNLKVDTIEHRWKDDSGLVGVIDGDKLLLTAFADAIIPPPLSSYTLTCANSINFVSFGKFESQIQILVVDRLNQVSVYLCNFTHKLKDVTLVSTFNVSLPTDLPLTCYNWLWLTKDNLLFIKDNAAYKLAIGDKESTPIVLCNFENQVGGIEVNSESMFVQYQNGAVVKLSIDNPATERTDLFNLPQFSNRYTVTENNEYCCLSSKAVLYVNGNQIATGVTSYALIDRFVAYTTFNELFFFNLDKTNLRDVYTRKIENGAKIVNALSKQSKIVLQMPRGNLEAIYPRILVIKLICKLLDQNSYKEAYEVVRRQRINLNLIVDHNPARVLENLQRFVDSIDNVQWLNLFISELDNSDVTTGCYADCYLYNVPKTLPNGYNVQDKVTFICDQLLSVLADKKYEKYLLSRVTCYVKKGDLESALQIIWNVRLKEEGGDVIVCSSEEAFKYLLYLVDVNELYKVALGTYDFGLVVYVAKRSQKDPKEYSQFLQMLDGMEENYRKFSIDNHLKRYSKAIHNIAHCGIEKLPEAIVLIKKFELYSDAIAVYVSDRECYGQICLEYANFLVMKGRPLEASTFYEKADDLSSALKFAKQSFNWRRVVMLKNKLDPNGDDKEFYNQFIDSLADHGKYMEAAEVALFVLKDTVRAVQLFALGKHFQEAINICKSNCVDVESTELLSALKGYLILHRSSIESELSLFKSQVARLKIVRAERNNPDQDQVGEDEDCDMFSDTTSMRSSTHTGSSKRTGSSFKSSKNRRKHERKLLSLKEGNKFEDLALVNSLHTIAVQTFALDKQKHIQNTCLAAIELGVIDEAKNLQSTFKKLQKEVKDALDDIWIPEMIAVSRLNSDVTNEYFIIKKEEHYSMLDDNLRFKPKLEKIDWEVHMLL